MNRDKKSFVHDIGKEIDEENVAVFAGAGMSAGAGFVDWAELLRPIADELGLDVNKEHDLVALAQYHCNDNGNNRSQLNKRLIEEFSREVKETENHRILCRLPIHTFWTTNYDKLIENSLNSSGKVSDVKYTKDQLADTKPKRDAVVYKMHGDVEHPNEAVLTKDDYEKYHVKMEQYLSKLKGDLISKTFIFIGFSFSDPNLDYILSRVRVAFDGNQRRHYCFIKNVAKYESETVADFEYRKRKQELFVNDLGRFNVKSILIDEYNEITELLQEIETRYKSRTVFISGAANDFSPCDEKSAQKFMHNLSSEIISRQFKIVSGFGLGVGSAVISGALEQIYMRSSSNLSDQLILRPFPQESSGQIPLPELWQKYREDMINHAGMAIFLFGNKYVNGKLVLSNGMRQEYEIAKQLGLFIIPVGATGYVAEEIWDEEMKLINDDEGITIEVQKLFSDLGDKSKSLEEMADSICTLISLGLAN
jgi:hypothetical protein